jgi:hypothetical protein
MVDFLIDSVLLACVERLLPYRGFGMTYEELEQHTSENVQEGEKEGSSCGR